MKLKSKKNTSYFEFPNAYYLPDHACNRIVEITLFYNSFYPDWKWIVLIDFTPWVVEYLMQKISQFIFGYNSLAHDLAIFFLRRNFLESLKLVKIFLSKLCNCNGILKREQWFDFTIIFTGFALATPNSEWLWKTGNTYRFDYSGR